MRHEQREVFVVAPEGIHLINGSIDVERLLDVHSTPPLEWRHSRKPELAAACGAHQETGADRLEDTRQSSASCKDVQRQQAPGDLPHGAAAATSRPLTGAGAKSRIAEALEITDARAVSGGRRN